MKFTVFFHAYMQLFMHVCTRWFAAGITALRFFLGVS